MIDVIDEAGLRGRGGAAYPTARKWLATRERSRGKAVVVGNGAETEPMSAKDRLLMASRPHLVLDGLVLAAEAVAAERAVVTSAALTMTLRRPSRAPSRNVVPRVISPSPSA